MPSSVPCTRKPSCSSTNSTSACSDCTASPSTSTCPSTTQSSRRSPQQRFTRSENTANCACNRTGSSSSSCGGAVSTPGSEGSRGTSTESSRTSRSSKSRIPRPISLPKRLEDKLSLRSSPQRASSAGGSTGSLSSKLPFQTSPFSSDATKTNIKPSLRPLKSPSK